jgi:hypothetical protein
MLGIASHGFSTEISSHASCIAMIVHRRVTYITRGAGGVRKRLVRIPPAGIEDI